MASYRLLIRSAWRGFAMLLLVAALRMASVQGWYRTIRVHSNSMWPALSGPLRRSRCEDCRFTFDWTATSVGGHVVCPNCGADNDPHASYARAGDRLLVDRLGFTFRKPRRYELAVFRDEEDQSWQVKRIVGLPGERLAIERGDLWANGKRLQKTMAELWDVAILTHDAGRAPESKLPRRWRGRFGWEGDSRWFLSGDRHSAPLGYYHWLCFRNSSPPVARTEEVGPLDSYPCNQGLSRDLFSVTDLLVDCTLETSAPCVLEFQFSALAGEFVQIRVGRTKSLRRGITAESGFTRRRMSLQVAVCDGRVLVKLAGREILARDTEIQVPDHQTDGSPLQIRVVEGAIRLGHFRLFRDLYYLGPRGERDWRASREMGSDEYFVAGDNQPISIDSRATSLGVRRKQLIGTVLISPFP